MKNKIGKSLVKLIALALGIACTQSATAQSFKLVTVNGGAKLAQIAAGGASVWARATNGKPYILQGTEFVLANGIALSQIAVGGGNRVQADGVWGLDSSGNIYKAAKSGTSWVFSRVPGVLSQIAVGLGYQDVCHRYEVWGLNPSADIYRYNFCIKNWENIPGTLTGLAVGGGDIWGFNGNSQVFPFDFPTLTFPRYRYWGTNCSQITVGPFGAWVLCSPDSHSYSVREVNTGYAVALLTTPPLTELQAGGDGVWALDSAQHIFHLAPSTRSWIQVPGALFSISVGSGGGVWGLNGAGQPYKFTTP